MYLVPVSKLHSSQSDSVAHTEPDWHVRAESPDRQIKSETHSDASVLAAALTASLSLLALFSFCLCRTASSTSHPLLHSRVFLTAGLTGLITSSPCSKSRVSHSTDMPLLSGTHMNEHS